MTRNRQLRFAVIGLVAGADPAYRAALDRLAHKSSVVALHSASWRAAEEQAKQLQVPNATSIRALMRSDCDGVIVADAERSGWFPVAAALEAGRNVYFALPRPLDVPRLRELAPLIQASTLLVMPELRLRYTPATLRLRELLATDLGPVVSVAIRAIGATLPAPADMDLELIDWCRTTFAATPASISCRVDASQRPRPVRELSLKFPASAHRGSFTATIQSPVRTGQAERGADAAALAPPSDAWPVEFTVRCRDGEARIEDAVHIRWRTGGRERTESLSTERTAVSVAIDHFARRLAGGLIPAPTTADVLFAAKLADLARASLEQAGVELSCRVE